MLSITYDIVQIAKEYAFTKQEIAEIFLKAEEQFGALPSNLGLSPSEAWEYSGLGKTVFREWTSILNFKSTGTGRGERYNKLLIPRFVSKIQQINQLTNI